MDEKCRNAKRLKYSIDVTFVVRRGARKRSFANHGCDISPLVRSVLGPLATLK